MKPKHGDVPSSQSSCSCTSCTYKNESDRLSINKFIAQGSKVEKLYLDKYISLREKKLIAKLVRTRAVYDDLRTQLLSKSSLSEKADLRHRKKLKHARRSMELDDDAKRSGALIELVDLVDRGASRRLSECCSCCSCGSTIPLHDQEPKIHKHGRGRLGSLSSIILGHRPSDDRRKGKHFRHKPRYIHSDSILKPKLRENSGLRYDAVDENRLRTGRKIKNKIDGMGETAWKSLTKLRLSKRKIANKIKTGTNKSLENIRNAEQKLKGKIVEGIRKMTYEPKHIPVTPEEEEEIVFNAIKDSLILYREEMIQKALEQECVCDPEECEPEECLVFQSKAKRKMRKKLKKNIADKTKKKQIKPVGISTESEAEVLEDNEETDVTQFPYNEQDIMRKEQERKGRHISSRTTHYPYIIRRNTRSGSGFALRRCFCTLKLKPYKNRPKDNKIHHKTSQTNSKSLFPMMPYECDPGICIPYECDPIDCLKIIRNRGIRYSTMAKTPKYKSKSASNFASKSVSSGESKKLMVNEESSPQRHGIKNEFTNVVKLPRHISSNFRFNMEFSKGIEKGLRKTRHLNSQNKNEKDKHYDHHAHKSSQNTSSGKSNKIYTFAKHSLRRCFCTLKLDKAEPKRNKIQSYSRGTLTSDLSGGMLRTVKPKAEVRDKSTEKKLRKNNTKYALLPYECVPGICVPDECNPYMCFKLINQRKKVKTHNKQSGSDQRKTKSSYSVIRNRVKMQFNSSSQKNVAAAPKKKPAPRQTKSLTETSNKQTVRIGSSFSFDIEFYKKNSPPVREKPLNKHFDGIKRTSKGVGHKAEMKDRKSDGYTVRTRDTSSFVQTEMKEKSLLAQSNMKRCFCTLKLHKRARNKNKIETTSTGTEPLKKMYPEKEMSSKSTHIKNMNIIRRKLEPYECEPNACIPGQCDPYRCLERIKTRSKVKSKDFGALTNTLRRTSTSSETINYKRNKDATNNSYQKAKQINRHNFSSSTNHSKMFSDIDQKRLSRQAVRIESNFSFNIEFSKEHNQNSSKIIDNGRPNLLDHKGINYSRNYGKQGISQTSEIKKKSRPSSIGPALKRCFCTQKKYNRKNSPTVIWLQHQPFLAICKEDLNRKHLLAKSSVKSGIYSSSFISMYSSLYTDSSHNRGSKDSTTYQQNKINSFGFVCSRKSVTTNLKNQNTLIGVNHYLNRSFYAMNVQVQNKRRNRRKLKPYECEPGICIPGKCNPIQCQKWITKRLMKIASTMASTETRLQSGSSDILSSASKQQQYNKDIQRAKQQKVHQGVKHKTLPRSHKQAVRVGSSFSFDIQFSKEKTGTQQEPHKRKINKMHGSSTNTKYRPHENRSTRPSQVLRQHRTSQSAVAMQHKGFNTAPRKDRCFCTLKLQMKGKQNKNVGLKTKKNINNYPDVVKTANVGQNTRKQRRRSLSDLDPNECEPGVCVPGECDPRICLERIRRRGKDFGTNMRPNRMSTTSSMTSSQKKRYRNQQVHVKQRPLRQAKAVRAPVQNQYSVNPSPSRQAVRIGSSFSFNVEFYKNKSIPGEYIPTEFPSKTQYVQKKTKSQKIHGHRNVNHKSNQDSKPTREQGSEVELPRTYNKYTKTGAFMKRCFCVLKYLKPAKAKPKPVNTESNASVQTKYYREKRQSDITAQYLDPNECEPGVCIPGECDPRICIKRIRRRNANLNKMSSTERFPTRSTATLFRSPNTSRSAASYANFQNKRKINKHQVKQPSNPYKHRVSPVHRSAVRIGSNFSFNVDFFKENNKTENAPKAFKYQRRESATESTNINRKGKGVGDDLVSHNRESQVDYIRHENKSSEAGLMLKRCFCTLALRKHGGANPRKEKHAKEKRIKKGRDSKTTGTSIKKYKIPKKHNIKLYDLKPYECEPGVCIPGECDPYECKKRIERRLNKDSGTETMRQTSKSATTMKRDKNTHINRNTQALNRPTIPTSIKRHQPVNRTSKNRGARQAVRIGSNFSFNIEFSKNKTGTGDVNHFININPARRAHEQQNQSKNATSTSQITQDKANVHDAYSQVLANKVRSTFTEVSPLLKRCFCTLKLNRSEKNVKVLRAIPDRVGQFTNTDKLKNTHRHPIKENEYIYSKSTNTGKHKNMLRSLKPYECEPGICIPDWCDPHHCLKVIQRRMQSRMSNTDALRQDNMATTTSRPEYSSANTETNRIKRNKIAREAGDNLQTGYRRNEPSPTDSNKQVVRIGSNFSFNIEFFKDTCTNDTYTNKINAPVKKPKISNKTSRVTSSVSRGTSRFAGHRKLVDRRLQSHDQRMVSRGTGPVKKRCFCTLKLQKIGKQQILRMRDNSASAKIRTKISDSRILKEAGTRAKKNYKGLEPYECEPNTCIPGECNPLECYKRIKLRNLNSFGTDTMRPSMRSVYSLTNPYSRLKDMETQETAAPKSTNERIMRIPEPASDYRNRQSVCLGSNFSFNVEFNKEVSPNSMSNDKYDTPTIIDTPKKYRTSSQDAYNNAQRTMQRSVGSGITPLLKRCFCTLPLHNMEFRNCSYYAKSKSSKVTNTKAPLPAKRQKELPNESNRGIAPLIKRCLCTLAPHNTETKKNRYAKGKGKGKSNKCACKKDKDSDRGIFTRCLCSLYPDKTVKKKKAKKKDKKHKELSKDVSTGITLIKKCLCSLAPYKTETNRSNKKEKKKDTKENKQKQLRNTRRQNPKSSGYGFKRNLQGDANVMPMIIEQPRFPHMRGIRIGSNISLNIEFFKEHILPKYFQKKTNDMTVQCVDKIITLSPFKPTQYYICQMKQHRYDWPDDYVRNEMRAANMKLNNEFRSPKLISNTQIQVKEELVSKNVNNNKYHDHTMSKNRKEVNKKKNEFNEIETILPFKSKQFNKTESNTLFPRKAIAKGAKHYFKRQSCNIVKEQVFNRTEMPSNAKSNHNRLIDEEKSIILSRSNVTMYGSIATSLKKFFCMRLFSNHRRENTKHDLKSNTNNSSRTIKPKAGVLKIAEFENYSLVQPKTSISLKTTATNIQKKQLHHQKKNKSRLEEAKLRRKAPDKSLVCDLPKCVTAGKILKVEFSEQPIARRQNQNTTKSESAISNQQQEKTSLDPRISREIVKSLDSPKSVNPKSLFKCACTSKFSKRKNKFINSQLTIRFTHSGYKQSCSCYVCKSQNVKHPYGANVIVNYLNENRKGQDLTKQSKKAYGKKPCGQKPENNNELEDHNKYKNKSCDNTKQNKTGRISVQTLSQHRKLCTDALLAESMKIVNVDTIDENTLRLLIGKINGCPVMNCLMQHHGKNAKCSHSDDNSLNIASLKKKPAFYYAFFRLYPLCLSGLKTWKQCMYKILLLIAAVVWSPCIFFVKGCRAAM